MKPEFRESPPSRWPVQGRHSVSPLVEEKSVQKLRQEAVMRWSVVGSGAFAVCILGWLAIR